MIRGSGSKMSAARSFPIGHVTSMTPFWVMISLDQGSVPFDRCRGCECRSVRSGDGYQSMVARSQGWPITQLICLSCQWVSCWSGSTSTRPGLGPLARFDLHDHATLDRSARTEIRPRRLRLSPHVWVAGPTNDRPAVVIYAEARAYVLPKDAPWARQN